jgi:AraC family transcriptional regulator
MYKQPSKLPVLVVEQRETPRLQQLLSEQKLTVLHLRGTELIGFLKQQDAATVVLDMGLPAGEAVALLGKLTEQKPQIPVIAVLESPGLEGVPEHLRFAPVDYLSHPVSWERLGESLRNALSVRCLNQVASLLRNTPCRHDAHPASTLADDGGPVRFSLPDDVPYRLRQAVEFMEVNLSKPLSLESIAGKACLSKYHFSREFKRYLGMSPIRFMMTRRICHATLLLQNTAFSISRVALQSGFNDQSEFTKWFKKTTGFTPSWYRKSFGARDLQHSSCFS